MAITEKRGRPMGVFVVRASRYEICLVELALDACFVSKVASVLIGTKHTIWTR